MNDLSPKSTLQTLQDITRATLDKATQKKLKDPKLLHISFVDRHGKDDTAFIKVTSQPDFSKKSSNFEATYKDNKGLTRTIFVPLRTKFV